MIPTIVSIEEKKTAGLVLGGGFKYFLFSPGTSGGNGIQFDEHIFQMG